MGQTNEEVPTGRPRVIASPEEFDQRVDAYVAKCRQDDEPVTFTGMALALGFCARQSLYDYQGYPGFSDSVKRARALVENEYEKRLHGTSPTGSIFALKNHGWRDRPEEERAEPEDEARRIAAFLRAMREADVA